MSSRGCDAGHCITCGDVAEEMQVLRLDRDRGLALCSDRRGEHHTVEVALVEPVSLAEELLVHAGTAIANLGPSNGARREAEEVPGR